MKRINNLFEKIISVDNLHAAYLNARKRKVRSKGVLIFEEGDINQKLLDLHIKLKEGSFVTSKYHIFNIVTREGKERQIYQLPFYPDRIVHHAILNVLEPIWTKSMSSSSYCCVKSKGIHGIVKKLKKVLVKYPDTAYCLKLDVKKFYPSINHDIMKVIIRKKIKDKQVLKLLDNIIDSADGMPIGNYTSQFFANLYLTYYDHAIKQQGQRHYFRYADDIVMLADSKDHLHKLLGFTRDYFQHLKLEIKSNFQIFPVESRGIDFVGYVFFHGYTLMRKSIKKRFARSIKQKPCNLNDLPQIHSGYWGWAKHCNSRNLLNKLCHESI